MIYGRGGSVALGILGWKASLARLHKALIVCLAIVASIVSVYTNWS
jgi:hypothetical protein